LISQILDLSKIEAGKLQIETTKVRLGELRSYVEGNFRQVAEQKGLDFKITIAPDAPASLTTDSHRLQQILKNLLSNGFKFTEKGRVELRVARVSPEVAPRSAALQQAKRVLAFSVTDSGIGIAEDKLQLVFEAFQQADASTSRMYGGTGLGLTISRELARLLGGELEVKSSVGIGSTFTLYLPLSDADLVTRYADEPEPSLTEITPPMPLLKPPPGPIAQLLGRKVLMIDDDARNLFAVTSLLERAGMSVVSASTAQEGLGALKDNPGVDAVLMDIMLPGMDGYQATREIRSQTGFESLPIIALTAKAMPGDREKCLEAGCTDFVPKPVDTDQLIATMQRVLGN
jgi:CheY-like chemotaxis protein